MPQVSEVQASIIIEPKVYELPTPDLHTAIITKIEDLGLVESDLYGAQEKVRIHYKLTDEKDSKGADMVVFETTTKSLGEKARLGKRLRSLGINTDGKFDLAEIVGLNVNLGIVHNKKGEKTYANVDFVTRVKGGKKPLSATLVEEV